MKKVFARATYKRYLPEMMIYIAVWLIVLMVPVVSNFFELLSGKVEVMRWKGVFILWLNVLPFFFLFLLNNRVLAPFLFLKQKVVVYVVVAILLSTFTFWVVDMVSPSRPVMKRQQIEQRMRGPGRESMMLPVSLRGRIYRLYGGDVLILGILTSHVRLSKRCLSLCPCFVVLFWGAC